MPHKLLLADDSVTIQRVIELTFADEDVQVTAVGNGKQAIEHAERDRPDIVLADVGMPERDGYEVAAFIKGHPEMSHVPVVLLTGAFEPIDEARARAVGCDGVLVKPFEPQMVINRVKDLLAGRRPAGLWNAGPIAQGPVRAPAAHADMHPPAAVDGGDPLEAYFDRLDAAFATLGTGAPEGPAAGAATADTSPLSDRPHVPQSAAQAHAPRQPVHAQSASQRSGSAFDDLASWDPDIPGDPQRPVTVEDPGNAPFAPPPAPPVAPPPAARASAPQAVPPIASQVVTPVAPQVISPVAPPVAAPPAPHAPAGVMTPPPSLVDAFTALLAAEQKTAIAPSQAPGGRPAFEVDDRLVEQIASRVLSRITDQSVRPTVLDVAERLVREEIDRIKNGR